MFTVPLYNTDGKEVEKIKLDEKIFCDIIFTSTIHQTIVNFRANQRKGLAATKTRGEVSGGGKKPWRQKGTGRARVGSTRSPLWRHGGVVFGPHPRDYSYEIPEKIKRLALRQVLSLKAKENDIIVLDDLKLANPKTKELVKILVNLKLTSGKQDVLLLMSKIDSNLKKAAGNINFLKLDLVDKANTYEIITADKVLLTKDSLKDLINRVKKSL